MSCGAIMIGAIAGCIGPSLIDYTKLGKALPRIFQ